MSDTKEKLLATAAQLKLTNEIIQRNWEALDTLRRQVWQLEDQYRTLLKQWHKEEGVLSPLEDMKSDTRQDEF